MSFFLLLSIAKATSIMGNEKGETRQGFVVGGTGEAVFFPFLVRVITCSTSVDSLETG
jgi:hypothetical protein